MHGAAQRQVRTRAQVVPGTFFVDTSHHVLYLGTETAGRADALVFELVCSRPRVIGTTCAETFLSGFTCMG